MEKIYSKVSPGVLLHIVSRKEEINTSRTDISPEDEYLQLSSFILEKGKTFRPHKHIIFEKTTDIAQESWVVLDGSVRVIFYDLNDEIIAERDLNQGDVSLTFRGGHNYLILSDTATIYEFKTGPYLGQEYDKVFIDE